MTHSKKFSTSQSRKSLIIGKKKYFSVFVEHSQEFFIPNCWDLDKMLHPSEQLAQLNHTFSWLKNDDW